MFSKIIFTLLLVSECTSCGVSFCNFIQKYNKSYRTVEEKDYREGIFNENLKLIETHNAGNHTYTLGINQFADTTLNEFKELYLGMKKNNESAFNCTEWPNTTFDASPIPENFDWRDKGVVGPVKDQKQCGSCWAFSAIGAIESALAIQVGKLYDLSEQQLVDCSGPWGNFGCFGGIMDYAFRYLADTGPLCQQHEYPYSIAPHFTCRVDKCKDYLKRPIMGCVDVSADMEYHMAVLVAKLQPLAVGLFAEEWRFYSGGIFDSPTTGEIDHGVVIVGYGYDETTQLDYWIIKNSWSASWGEQGYIRIKRGVNLLRVTESVSYPVTTE